MNKARFLSLIAVLVLSAACRAEDGPAAPAPAPPPGAIGTALTSTPLPTRAVTPRSAIVADGTLALTKPIIALSFETSAKVVAVNVKVGQRVRKGEVLAQLDDSQLQDALARAKESLAVTEAQIAQNNTPPREEDLISARAAVSSASARYRELKNGATQNDIEQALRSWNSAKNGLYQAQVQRDISCGFNSGTPEQERRDRLASDIGCRIQDKQVQSTELNERAAYQRYQNLLKPTTWDKLAQAYADLVSAQASLSKLEAGRTVEQMRVDEAQLAQARIAVERAERSLAQAVLTSPCDCSVQEVNVAVGVLAGGSTPAIKLVDLSSLRFRTSNLSERDLAEIKAGAPAIIRLRPFADTFQGAVNVILPQAEPPQSSAPASDSSGSATGAGSSAGSTTAIFTVLIDIDPAGQELLPGMTGEAEITVQ